MAVMVLIFLFIGFYGGFIQIGVGLLLLTALSVFSSDNLKSSNAIKLFIVLIYTIPTTILFIIKGKIIWVPAISLAFGQILGGIAAGYVASVVPNSDLWIRYVIIIMILITLINLLR
jgi:hypothetical protein